MLTIGGQKKRTERIALEAARKAGVPIPHGEVPGEKPDFRFQTHSGALGLEVSELLRPASSNDGIMPVEAENFHKDVMEAAKRRVQRSSQATTRVVAYFSKARGKKQDKDRLIKALAECVLANRERANPAVIVGRSQRPEGFDHVLITAEEGDWWCGEGGGITLSEIRREVGFRVAAKNKLVSNYRKNLPEGAQIWLLLFTQMSVSRSMPIPYGIEEWIFQFNFDRVFWFAFLENDFVEIRRA
jgi:hypothetical protein